MNAPCTLALTLAALAACLRPVSAATWDGGLSKNNFTVNNLWSTQNNWVGSVPVSSPTTDVRFTLSGIRTTANQNISNPFVLRSITFDETSNVTSLSGTAIQLASGGTIAQNASIAATISTPLTLSGQTAVTGGGSGRISLTNAISGGGALLFSGSSGGPGLLATVSGASNYSGGTQIGVTIAGPAPADVTMASGTAFGTNTIQFNNGNTLRAAGNLTVANPLVLFAGPNGLVVRQTFGTGGNFNFTGPINVAAAQEVRIENALISFSGNVTGAATVIKTGPGTLLLSGANNSGFTGTWAVSEGALRVGNATALAQAQVLVQDTGSLDFQNLPSVDLGRLSGTRDIPLGTSTVNIGLRNQSSTYSGSIAATSSTVGGLRKVGTAAFTLSGPHSEFGSFIVERGTMNLAGGFLGVGGGATVGGSTTAPVLNLTNAATMFCPGNVTALVSGGSGTSLSIDGAATALNVGFQLVIAGGNGPGASTGLITIRNSGTASVGFMVVGAGESNGTGTLQIENGGTANSIHGIVGFILGSPGVAQVTGPASLWNTGSLGLGGFNSSVRGGVGTLTVADRGAVVVNGPTTFWTPGSRIDVRGGRLVTDSLVADGAPDATVALADGEDTVSALTLGGSSDSTFPGTLTNSTLGPGGLTKTGSGTVTLTGPLDFTGATRVNGGRLVIPQNFPFATITQIASGGTLDFTGNWGTNGISAMTIANGGRLIGGGTVRGSLSNSGLVEITGTRTFRTTGPVVNSGVMRFRSGATFTATGTFVNTGVLDVISAAAFNPPPGFVDQGTVLTRFSLHPVIQRSGTVVTVTLRAFAGHTYQLQRSSTLNAADFADVGTPQATAVDATLTFTDPGATGPERFYRIKVD